MCQIDVGQEPRKFVGDAFTVGLGQCNNDYTMVIAKNKRNGMIKIFVSGYKNG